jgi:hypothetical protein
MDDIHVDMGEKVKEEVSTLKTRLVNDVKAEIKSSLQNNIRTELKEIEDQKQRALNLILFNVPESKSENSLKRKKFDNDIFTELCNAVEVVEADVKVAFRLGNPKKETHRPLKLVMNNKKHRKDIIENALKLKLLPQTSRLAKYIIAKDLTIRQREENKKRWEEEKQNGKKKPTRNDQAYNDETVYHIRKSTNKITTAIATVENVQDNMVFSLANYQSQPLLTNIVKYQRHANKY